MLYITFLEAGTIILAFLIKLVAFYFLMKLFNKVVKFSTILKPVLLYELGVFLFFLIDPSFRLIYFFPLGIRNILLYPLCLLITVVILFLFFNFLMSKFSLFTWKKSLIVFLIMFFLITPLLSYSQAVVTNLVAKLPVFVDEVSELKSILYSLPPKAFLPIFLPMKFPIPLPLRILGAIKNGFLEEKFLTQLRMFIMTR